MSDETKCPFCRSTDTKYDCILLRSDCISCGNHFTNEDLKLTNDYARLEEQVIATTTEEELYAINE